MLSLFNGMSITPEIENSVYIQIKEYVDLCFIRRKFVALEY
jgi:hypothetical protein